MAIRLKLCHVFIMFKFFDKNIGCDSNLKMVTVKIPENYVNGLKNLVGKGMYPSRSAAIRVAVRDLLKEVLWMANENATLMDATITFKRWIIVTCPACRNVVYVRRDWKSRRCPHCRKSFHVNYDELLIIGTCEKLADTQKYISKPSHRRGSRSW